MQHHEEEEDARRLLLALNGVFHSRQPHGRQLHGRQLHAWLQTFASPGVCARMLIRGTLVGAGRCVLELAPDVPHAETLGATAQLFAAQTLHKLARRSRTNLGALRDLLLHESVRAHLDLATPVATQLALALAALAVRGLEWPPDDVLPLLGQALSPQRLARVLQALAEQVTDDTLSVAPQQRPAIGQRLVAAAPQVLALLRSLNSPCVAACAVAWAEAQLLPPSLLPDALELVLSGQQEVFLHNDQQEVLLCDAVRACCKAAAAPKLRQARRAETLQQLLVDPERPWAADVPPQARTALRAWLCSHVLPLLALGVRRRLDGCCQGKQSDAANLASALVAVCAAALGEQLEAATAPPAAVFETPLGCCRACDRCGAPPGVAGALGDFWLALAEHADLLENDAAVAPQLEQGAWHVATALCVYPAEELYRDHWSAERREAFLLQRRDARDVLREVLRAPREERFLRRAAGLLERWADDLTCKEWRHAEALLHAVSAIARDTPAQDAVSAALVALQTALQRESSAPRPLLRTAALLCAVAAQGDVAPRAAAMAAVVRAALAAPEEEGAHSMVESTEHVAVVALVKMAASPLAREHLLANLLAPDGLVAAATECLRDSARPGPSHLSAGSTDLLLAALCDLIAHVADLQLRQQLLQHVLQQATAWAAACEARCRAGDWQADAPEVAAHVAISLRHFGVALRRLGGQAPPQALQPGLAAAAAAAAAHATRTLRGLRVPGEDADAEEVVHSAACDVLAEWARARVEQDALLAVLRGLVERISSSAAVEGAEEAEQAAYRRVIDVFRALVEARPSGELADQALAATHGAVRALGQRLNAGGRQLCEDAVASSVLRLLSALVEAWCQPQDAAREAAQALSEAQLEALEHCLSDALWLAASAHGPGQRAAADADQEAVMALVRFERALLLGRCRDNVPPSEARSLWAPWWVPRRERIFEQRHGRSLLLALLLGAGGALPSWAIDRLALLVIQLLGQFRSHNWLAEALGHPALASVSEKNKALLCAELERPQQQVIKVKRVLKHFGGGKKKGQTAQRPPAQPR